MLEKMVQDRKRKDILVESSGTSAFHSGEKADSRMRQAARKRGYDLESRALAFLPHFAEEYDLILAMDHANYASLRRIVKSEELFQKKIKMFRDFDPVEGGEVPDPYYGGCDGFERVMDMIERTCSNLIRVI